MLDEFLMGLNGKPGFIGGNLKLIAKIRACAERAGLYAITVSALVKMLNPINGIPLVDFGAKAGSNDPVCPTDAGSGENFALCSKILDLMDSMQFLWQVKHQLILGCLEFQNSRCS